MTATTDEAALLAGIAQWPLDATPRLVYADYLEEQGRAEDCRDQRLHVAQKRICEEPASDEARLEWARIAESVPVDEGELEEVRRGHERVLQHRPGHNGGTSTGMRDPMRDWREAVKPLRTREAVLTRTLSLRRRAEFVRVQVELVGIAHGAYREINPDLDWSHPDFSDNCKRAVALRKRERELVTCLYWQGRADIGGGYSVAHTAGYCPPDRFLFKLFPPNGGAEVANVDFDRGFISRITCDWQTWLSHGQFACWRPGWSRECERCDGQDHTRDIGPTAGFALCPACHGTGRTLRPFTGHEQPLTELVLTTVPEPERVDGDGSGQRFRLSGCAKVYQPSSGEWQEDIVRALFAVEWPGLKVRFAG